MQKNNDKQESIQLSLFDSFISEPPETDPAKKETVAAELNTQEKDRPATSTEELLRPMVIYFDPDSVSVENTGTEQENEYSGPYLPLPSPDKNRKLKVLITGASGFIGGFLVREALHRGYEVWAGIRAGSSRARLRDERIRFIDLAYDEEIKLTKQLDDFRRDYGAWNYIVHNAGITKTPDKSEFFRINAGYTSRFIEALNVADCRPDKFLLMSSLSSYGAGDEKGFTPISLDDEQHPDTAYGMSKLQAENSVRGQDYFPYIILRPTGVYGPGDQDYFMEIKSIRSGFDFAVGMTPQRITFIYVKDLATVVFLALEKDDVKNRHYFVADGDVYTDRSFARMIQGILLKKRVLRLRIPAGPVYVACLFSETIGKLTRKSMTLNTDKYKILKQRNWICDVTPLQEDLGFIPAYSLREGLEETIAWYMDEGWLF
jgi:nucleoside-diphosphate-sugar epimerase